MPSPWAFIIVRPYSNEDKRRCDQLAQKYGFYFVKTYIKIVQNETFLQIPTVLKLKPFLVSTYQC
jgi:hypothetical protein